MYFRCSVCGPFLNLQIERGKMIYVIPQHDNIYQKLTRVMVFYVVYCLRNFGFLSKGYLAFFRYVQVDASIHRGLS